MQSKPPPTPPPAEPNAAVREAQAQFQQALALYGDGRVAKAQALCENIVKKFPRFFDAFHLLGVLAYQAQNHVKAAYLIGKAIEIYPNNADFYANRGLPLQELGQFDAALASFEKAIALKPNFAAAHYNRANVLKDLKKLEAAVASFDKAIALQPNLAEAHYGRGIVLQGLNRLEAAVASYDRAIALRPDFVEAHYNRANTLHQLHNPEAALAGFDAVIALKPDFAEAHCNRGNVLKELKGLDAALASYDRAIAIKSNVAEFHCNRGNLLQELRRPADAVACYDRAVAIDPRYGEAYFNRGVAQQRLERLPEALASYDRAIELNPDYPEVYHNRGLILRQLNRHDDALASHTKATELRPDHLDSRRSIFWLKFSELNDVDTVERLSGEVMALQAKAEAVELMGRRTIPGFRLLHDLEQTAYLLAEGHTDDGLREAHDTLQAVWSRQPAGEGLNAYAVPLAEHEIAGINRFRNNLIRYPTSAALKHILNPDNDWRAIEDQYFGSRPEIVHIDNLLTEPALVELRKFGLISTVWKSEYKNQYLGAFAQDGFVGPLHFQLALELRQKMPRIFGEHALEHLWGFKYTANMSAGINVHADFARVNLNFWVTPDDANLDPTTGGLVVYDVPAPASWSFHDYNRDEASIYAFLEKSGAGKRRVPYRCNRAVLFNSNLFHETDELHFKEGYENRRVNITYLFGRGLRTQ